MASPSRYQLNSSALRSEGFVYVEDSALGQEVEKLQKIGFPLRTQVGLQFCRQSVLEDERVQPVLRSFFDAPCLGIYHSYSCDPDHTYTFMKKEGSDPPALVIHLFTPETRILLFERSQLQTFKTWHASNGMLEVANAALRKANIMAKEVVLNHGGLVIADTRLCFRTMAGDAIIAIFADKEGEEIKTWDKIELQKVDNLEQEVAEMERSGIWTNFTYA
ncbi:hypothetical protein CEP51_015118 [Fusarium floridanum]|uniref:Uncharacterized protein n=1 Tax=Fusarium floridanum TaxID=1325733 RepID=A0A428PGB9_9HYPO|nr:hypothetical protein CEP51_015118 [Fusarium floridanum]